VKFESSYSPSGWATFGNLQAEPKRNGYRSNASWYWETITNMRQPNNVPLFGDCTARDAWPHHTNTPPDYEVQLWSSFGPDAGMDEMKRYCINRHDGGINLAFADGSARRVALRGLWDLQWNRAFDTNRRKPTWPDWMKNLPSR
jgi:prepilin-type processing-associated H-X9-DG protein